MPVSGNPAAPSAPRWNIGDTLLAALGFGVAAGAGEALVHAGRDHLLHRTLFMAPEYPWQLPLAEGAVFLALGVVFVLVSLFLPRLRSPRIVSGLFGAVAGLAVLLLFERIHWAAEVMLALGIGVICSRLAGAAGTRARRRLRIGVPLVVLLLGATGGALHLVAARAGRKALGALPKAFPGQPNILLLVLDTARAWSMGLYGYGRPTTPLLSQWASRGVLFDRALAPAPWTTLSHAVMFTGRYPTELSVGWDRPLDGQFPTLAEALSQAGYATAGFVANYSQAGRPTGLSRGFGHYEDYPAQPIPILRRVGLLRRLLSIDRVAEFIGRRRMVDGKIGETVNQEFLHWVEGQQKRPWFAFLNYYDAHGPYLPPAPYDTMFFARPAPVAERFWDRLVRAYGRPPVPVEDLVISMDAYDGGINYLDAQVDAVLRSLGGRGQLDNTIIVVTSDHGELFGEHGVIAHGNSLYLPVLHVPLLLIAPGRVPGGIRISSVASLRDLPATLLELANIANPGLGGHSLVPSWSAAGTAGVTDTAFASVEYNRLLPRSLPAPILRGSMRTVVLDSLQYVLNGDGKEELYHLGRDSWEIRNLVDSAGYQPDLARYRNAMRAIPSRSGFAPVPR
jgi:arylsulfatase A-like enzyme